MLQMCAAKCVSLGLLRLLTAGAVALAALRFSDPGLNSPSRVRGGGGVDMAVGWHPTQRLLD